MGDDHRGVFLSLGLDEKTVKETLKNPTITQALQEIIQKCGCEKGCGKEKGKLLYALVTRTTPAQRSLLLPYVVVDHITSTRQLDGGLEYLKATEEKCITTSALEAACGVGIVVTDEEVEEAVDAVLAAKKGELLKRRYDFPLGLLLGSVMVQRMRWADGKKVKDCLEKRLISLLGPQTDEDRAKKSGKKRKEEKEKGKENKEKEGANGEKKQATVGDIKTAFFPKPTANKLNPKNLLERHLKITAGRVQTRFPPEPNGYLHIGHAKSMNLNFGYARAADGVCYLRFDDTNPEAEKQEYIESVLDNVNWLGHKPWKITYSSDYFEELYKFGVQLIQQGDAYADHQTAEEMSEYREKKMNSPWRDRPIEESLTVFEDMRKGKYWEGSATVRFKGDMAHDNPCMRDMVAFRVKFHPHPRTGDTWCIYPSYDMEHCCVDALEDITHSLCTLEFVVRQHTYYWLLDKLRVWKPIVWEFSRLNLTHNVLSKRKLQKLVKDHIIHGWDDPRLLTINGLRRRGYSPEAISSFCDAIGVTRSENTVKMQTLEYFCRTDMDERCPRAMAVLNPLRVVLTNYPEDHVEVISVPNHPKYPERGTHNVFFSRTLYIDRADFRLKDEKDYYGLAPHKEVGLRHAFNIFCTNVIKDDSGEVVELQCTVDVEKKNKLKGHIHWVGCPAPGKEPLIAEVRLYDVLFNTEDPASVDDWMQDVNKDSETMIPRALVDASLENASYNAHTKTGDRFQFERVGFFTVDPDSDVPARRLVFNRTVTLKESYPKFSKRSS